jgi:hypothetical protein
LIGFRATEQFKVFATRLPTACSTSMSALALPIGAGLRKVFPTPMHACLALILAGWRSNNQRMIEVGMDSLKWLVAEQHRDNREIFVPIGSADFH